MVNVYLCMDVYSRICVCVVSDCVCMYVVSLCFCFGFNLEAEIGKTDMYFVTLLGATENALKSPIWEVLLVLI